jgi:hypothetical protein
MKNICTSAFLAITLIFSATAQIIDDDFEFYTLGDMGNQNPTVWSTWTGVLDDGSNILVVDDIVFSGIKSGYIGPGSVQDCVLLLGNRTSGEYTLSFQMYITGGSTGYFNVQGEIVPPVGNGVFNSSNMYFNNAAAAPGIFEDQTTGETGTYPENAWFKVQFHFDVNLLTYQIWVDENLINQNPVPFQADATLGGIDFFSIDANNNYWLDDVLFVEGPLFGIDVFEAKNFSIYPNPVGDALHIRSVAAVDAIAVYDVLGKLVLKTNPGVISPSIDMSALTSGIYLTQVTIGDASKIIKVIK